MFTLFLNCKLFSVFFSYQMKNVELICTLELTQELIPSLWVLQSWSSTGASSTNVSMTQLHHGSLILIQKENYTNFCIKPHFFVSSCWLHQTYTFAFSSSILLFLPCAPLLTAPVLQSIGFLLHVCGSSGFQTFWRSFVSEEQGRER